MACNISATRYDDVTRNSIIHVKTYTRDINNVEGICYQRLAFAGLRNTPLHVRIAPLGQDGGIWRDLGLHWL